MRYPEQIEEILVEANAYGMREAVVVRARMMFVFLDDMDELESYQSAFDTLVTNAFKTIIHPIKS